MKIISLLILMLIGSKLLAMEAVPRIPSIQGSHARHVEVRLGETVTGPIALGQVNRIVLPFEKPEIRTLNPATAEIQGHVLYIAPTDPAPLHLYVVDGDNSDASIALALTPEEIQPREIVLELVDSGAQRYRERSTSSGTESIQTSREGDPVDGVPQVLKTLALGQIPEGFRFRNPLGPESIRCRQKSALIQTRQVFEGHHLRVLVGVLKNTGKDTLSLQEESCLQSQDIRAVAQFPEGALPPGHEKEIYLVVGTEKQAPGRARPVLIRPQS